MPLICRLDCRPQDARSYCTEPNLEGTFDDVILRAAGLCQLGRIAGFGLLFTLGALLLREQPVLHCVDIGVRAIWFYHLFCMAR